MAEDVDVKSIARGTPGFNGAGEFPIILLNKSSFFKSMKLFCFFAFFFMKYLSVLPINFSRFFSSLSDLANLVNIAAIKAAVEGAEKLTATQLEFAKDRIVMGTERKTMFISDESKKVCISFDETIQGRV